MSHAKWETGETGYIDGKHVGVKAGLLCQAKVLDWAFSAEHDYLQLKLEITLTVDAFGTPVTRTWVYPHPIASYKLRRNPFDREKRPKKREHSRSTSQ